MQLQKDTEEWIDVGDTRWEPGMGHAAWRDPRTQEITGEDWDLMIKDVEELRAQEITACGLKEEQS